MKKILILLLIMMPTVHGLMLTEIFPNPTGDDNNKEYIEVYTEEYLNLSGYIIGDEASNDTLLEMQYINSSYALIVEEGFDYSQLNASIYSVGATIGNNLGNSNEGVFFYTNTGKLIESFHYNSTVEGMCYTKKDSEWGIAACTPRYTLIEQNNTYSNETVPNPVSEPKQMLNRVKVTSLLPETLYTHQEITTAFRIDNLLNEKIDVDVTYWIVSNQSILKNETRTFANISRYKTANTAEIVFENPGNYTLCAEATSNLDETEYSDNSICSTLTVIDASTISCDRSIHIALNTSIVENNKATSFNILINDNEEIPYVISYSIEEFNGITAKNTLNTTNNHIKKWTPAIKKDYGLFILRATLVEPGCHDTNLENNAAAEYIIVKNKQEQESQVSIDHIYLGNDGNAKTGEGIRTKITVYSGNISMLSSKTVKLYVQDNANALASQTTSIAVDENFQELTLTVPVILDYSCDKYPTTETDYTLIAEGLGTRVKQKFPVIGVSKELCDNVQTGEYITEFPTIAQQQETIKNSITIQNSDTLAHEYKVSSKVYRGPKTYTGDFFANQQTITIQPGKKEIMNLENTLPALEPGTYKVKIYVQKDEQKTLKEFTHDLLILGNETIAPEVHAQATIRSFFTLSTELNQEIPVISQIEGLGEYTLVLDTMIDRQNLTVQLNGTETYVFQVKLLEGKNLLMLSIVSNDTIIESKPLILFADQEVQEVVMNETIPNTNSAFEKITGNVILEPAYGLQDNYDHSLIGVLAFVFILITSCGIVIYKKKHKLFKRTTLSADYEECD